MFSLAWYILINVTNFDDDCPNFSEFRDGKVNMNHDLLNEIDLRKLKHAALH